MPTYQYRCPECKKVQELEASIHDGPAEPWLCFDCTLSSVPPRYVRMRRVWSAVPAIFRGGGWASKS